MANRMIPDRGVIIEMTEHESTLKIRDKILIAHSALSNCLRNFVNSALNEGSAFQMIM